MNRSTGDAGGGGALFELGDNEFRDMRRTRLGESIIVWQCFVLGAKLSFRRKTFVVYSTTTGSIGIWRAVAKFSAKLAPRGAWLRQKSCQEISCTVVALAVGIKKVCFV
jgi:hypothetical protein